MMHYLLQTAVLPLLINPHLQLWQLQDLGSGGPDTEYEEPCAESLLSTILAPLPQNTSRSLPCIEVGMITQLEATQVAAS